MDKILGVLKSIRSVTPFSEALASDKSELEPKIQNQIEGEGIDDIFNKDTSTKLENFTSSKNHFKHEVLLYGLTILNTIAQEKLTILTPNVNHNINNKSSINKQKQLFELKRQEFNKYAFECDIFRLSLYMTKIEWQF